MTPQNTLQSTQISSLLGMLNFCSRKFPSHFQVILTYLKFSILKKKYSNLLSNKFVNPVYKMSCLMNVMTNRTPYSALSNLYPILCKIKTCCILTLQPGDFPIFPFKNKNQLFHGVYKYKLTMLVKFKILGFYSHIQLFSFYWPFFIFIHLYISLSRF